MTDCCCAVPQEEHVVINIVAPEPPKKKSLMKKILPVVELICRLALGIFAAIMCFKAFVIAGSVGLVVGIAYTIYKNVKKEPIEVGLGRPSCGTGFFDYLSGIRYPAIVSSVITAVYVGIHMHHSPLLVAFCCVPLGIFVGTQLTQLVINLAYRDIHALTMPPIKHVRDVFSQPPGMVQAG